MDERPDLERFSEHDKDALMVAWWAAGQRWHTRVAELEAKRQEPGKDARNASVPPSHTRQANTPTRPPQGMRREASGGRAGGGRPLHPDPDPVIIATAKGCAHGGHEVPEAGQSLQAVDDKIELPPLKPIVTRVEPYGRCGADCGQPYVAPVPAGMEPGTPFGTSVQSLATYLRYAPAIRYERLSALLAQVCGLAIRAGGLANVCRSVTGRLDQRLADILTRVRSRRVMCRDETRARVHGRQPWAWVLPNAAVCIHVIRPSRGQGVMPEVLGTHRPTIWGSDRYRAQQHHPAEPWPVCVAHQVRDWPCALEAGALVFAPRMQLVWLRACALHTRRDTLAASTLYQSRGDRRRRGDRGRASQPTNPHGRRLQKRDAKIQEHVFLLLEDATVPPTHHASAQAIRLSTVFRNVTNGVRSDGGRDLCAAVRSVVQTGKRHGLSAFQAIQRALSPVGSLFDPG